MKKGWLEIYALLVCFFTVACLAVVFGMGVWDIVKISAPDFTLYSGDWEAHQTDETFREHLIKEHRRCDDEEETYKPPEGAALTQAKETSFGQALRSERRQGFKDLIQNLIILLIDVGLFAVHWKIAARARQSAG